MKDDFGLYVNKPWILQTEFTPGIPVISAQTEVQVDVMNRLLALMSFHVVDPDYFAALQTVFSEENVPLIRDWLVIDAAMYIKA